MQTNLGWVLLPENRAAWEAVEQVRECVTRARPRRRINPLFLHGPVGTGKTRLLQALIAGLLGERADLSVVVLPAGDLAGGQRGAAEEELAAARQAELVVVEDAQHLPEQSALVLAELVDRCVARQVQLIASGTAGPGRLGLPVRLASRLAGGLVVGLEPFGPSSRLEFLRRLGEGRGCRVDPAVLAWLAENTPGSARQLEGALTRLADLTRALGRPPDEAEVRVAFQPDAEMHRPTVERIAQRVSRHFRVEPARLRSRGRTREVLLPRQVGMYLARQLTALSLEQIGAYFGGRDHTTVLHACRKVEQALVEDPGLSGAVRQLHAELS